MQKYNEKDWINVAGEHSMAPPPAKKNYSYYPHLQFDENGVAYTVWEDASYVEKGYLKGGSWLSCSELQKGKWVWVGERAFVKDCSRPILSISNGKLYVLFKDYDEKVYEQNKVVLFMTIFENGQWFYLGQRAFNSGTISGTSFDFKVYKDTPYALFTYEDKWTGPNKERTNRIALMKFENNKWQEIGNLATLGAIYHLHLKFSSTGVPYVAYIDNFKKIRVRKFINGVWHDLGILGTVPFNGPILQNQWASSYQLCNCFLI